MPSPPTHQPDVIPLGPLPPTVATGTITVSAYRATSDGLVYLSRTVLTVLDVSSVTPLSPFDPGPIPWPSAPPPPDNEPPWVLVTGAIPRGNFAGSPSASSPQPPPASQPLTPQPVPTAASSLVQASPPETFDLPPRSASLPPSKSPPPSLRERSSGPIPQGTFDGRRRKLSEVFPPDNRQVIIVWIKHLGDD